MNIDRLVSKVSDLVASYLQLASSQEVQATRLGLDYCAGWLLVSLEDNRVAVEGSTSSVDYYGGFQYISSADIIKVGNFTFYKGTSNRVRECLDFYKQNKTPGSKNADEENK